MTTATTTPPAAAPAAAPAPATAAPATAAAPAPAAPPASLIHDTALSPAPAPGAAPAAAPAEPGTEPFTFAEKMLAKGADGATDWQATAERAEKARQHLEQRLGAGDVPPKSPAEYAFQLPEDMKDFQLKADRLDAFKGEALAHGITGKQFEFMMGAYLKAVPDLMEGAAAMTAQEARAELGKVWTAPADMDANLSNASRALRVLPAELQDATRDMGTNPAFLRALAHFGAQMREDRPPGQANPPAPQGDVRSLEASEAYRNPKHADHTRVSRQVADFYARAHGTAPI